MVVYVCIHRQVPDVAVNQPGVSQYVIFILVTVSSSCQASRICLMVLFVVEPKMLALSHRGVCPALRPCWAMADLLR